jgi:ketosteroid isomerase-like protein
VVGLHLKSSSSSSTIRSNKKLAHNNEDIVFEYFKLIKKKDIGNLMDLFAPDAIVYEPFSKITGGLKGKRAIESFLRVAIMANDTLQHQIVIEKESDVHEAKSDHQDNNNNDDYGSYNTKVITALVIFEKGDSLKARFTFELASDHSDNDHTASPKYNRIKTLHIHFLK